MFTTIIVPLLNTKSVTGNRMTHSTTSFDIVNVGIVVLMLSHLRPEVFAYIQIVVVVVVVVAVVVLVDLVTDKTLISSCGGNGSSKKNTKYAKKR